ncbi:DNA polymerase V [Orussus abietinus]|uniref:DNA polymerase V n=1 Tax=Orussus abietinus TaxID=222816 RepID=UPI0006255901|nr:DNA polymerase V [Orussus abietinus]
MAGPESCDLEKRKMRKMGTTVLDYFTKLTADKERDRLTGAAGLLEYFSRYDPMETENKELNYALTRLLRSLGASRVAIKKGSYTTLTAFLSTNPHVSVARILDIMNVQLHPVNSNSKGENADIYMGQILTCGALIRSNILLKSSKEDWIKVLEILLTAGKKRSYLSFISTSFVFDFITELDKKSFAVIWPLIQQEYGKSWKEQTLDTFYGLLFIQDKFPAMVNSTFLNKHLETDEIIGAKSIQNLIELLTDTPRIVCCQHPVYKIFCEKLVLTDYTLEFWAGIDKHFLKPSKSMEHLSLEIFKLIISNVKDKSIIPSLLTPNFLQHMLKRFQLYKKIKNDEVSLAFKETLSLLVTTVSDEKVKTKIQVAVLKKLILYPGDLMIEKITGTKIIQMIVAKLNAEGVKKIAKVYTEIVENSKAKEKSNTKTESWTNAERVYAVQLLTRLLGHPAVTLDKDWRLHQLIFLFTLGLCETPTVGGELSPQIKDSFYRALDQKFPKLLDLRTVLSVVVHHIHEEVFSKPSLKLRAPLADTAKQAWKRMMSLITKLEQNKNTEAVPIFHTMNLHMGLQLFSDPEMAIGSIDELHSCFDRLTKKKFNKLKKNSESINEDEPEWVDVVVDLLLSLLSRNSHLLRSLVGCVFPHVCQYLTASSIQQILAVLDIKSSRDPLTLKNDKHDEESSVAESDSDSSAESNEETESEQNENMEEESDTDSSNGSADEDREEEEDDTVTDRLRLAVREALGDASVVTDVEDIDVDQISKEEGKRLNESLAAAFRILRENRRSRSKKQEKSAQALTHFRVRVVDLLDMYLDSCPSMVLSLSILVPMFSLLEFCIKDPHQKPLENRVRSCLKKFSTVRKFKDTEDVDEQLLVDVLKALIEKGERSASVCQEMGDKLAECCTFLIRCVQQASLPATTFVEICCENLTAFFRKRDCILPVTLFKSILQLNWAGNWQLAPLLVDFAFDSSIRSFRRGQALEFLTIFYRNDRLIRSDEEHTKVRLKMEKKLCETSIKLLQELNSNSSNNETSITNKDKGTGKVRQKFICLLFTLLHTVRSHQIPQAWDWNTVAKSMAAYRVLVTLAKDAKTAYNRLASQIGAPINIVPKKEENSKPAAICNQRLEENGDVCSASSEGDSESEEKSTNKEGKKKKKNKTKRKDKQKLKKEARELRENAMSEGLQFVGFSSLNLLNGSTGDHESNHKREQLNNNNSTPSVQKRPLGDNCNRKEQSKRRKNQGDPAC